MLMSNFLDLTTGLPALWAKIKAIIPQPESDENVTSVLEQITNSGDEALSAETLASVEDEIVDARVGADGTTYPTVGDAVRGQVSDLKEDLEQIVPGLSEEAKQALLACFRGVSWITEDASTLYDELESALYDGQVNRLTVEFVPGYRTIFTDDPLESIKYNLRVLFNEETIGRNDYVLGGTLTDGQSVLTISYGGKKANITIPTVAPKWEISTEDSNLTLFKGAANKYAQDSSGYGCASLALAENRRTFYIDYGRYPYRQDNVGVLEGAYPITVPVNATKVTLTLSPSTYYATMFCSRYAPQNISWQPLLTLSPDKSSSKSPITFSLPESDGETMRTLSFSISRNSSGSSYSDGQDPTWVTIRFE